MESPATAAPQRLRSRAGKNTILIVCPDEEKEKSYRDAIIRHSRAEKRNHGRGSRQDTTKRLAETRMSRQAMRDAAADADHTAVALAEWARLQPEQRRRVCDEAGRFSREEALTALAHGAEGMLSTKPERAALEQIYDAAAGFAAGGRAEAGPTAPNPALALPHLPPVRLVRSVADVCGPPGGAMAVWGADEPVTLADVALDTRVGSFEADPISYPAYSLAWPDRPDELPEALHASLRIAQGEVPEVTANRSLLFRAPEVVFTVPLEPEPPAAPPPVCPPECDARAGCSLLAPGASQELRLRLVLYPFPGACPRHAAAVDLPPGGRVICEWVLTDADVREAVRGASTGLGGEAAGGAASQPHHGVVQRSAFVVCPEIMRSLPTSVHCSGALDAIYGANCMAPSCRANARLERIADRIALSNVTFTVSAELLMAHVGVPVDPGPCLAPAPCSACRFFADPCYKCPEPRPELPRLAVGPEGVSLDPAEDPSCALRESVGLESVREQLSVAWQIACSFVPEPEHRTLSAEDEARFLAMIINDYGDELGQIAAFRRRAADLEGALVAIQSQPEGLPHPAAITTSDSAAHAGAAVLLNPAYPFSFDVRGGVAVWAGGYRPDVPAPMAVDMLCASHVMRAIAAAASARRHAHELAQCRSVSAGCAAPHASSSEGGAAPCAASPQMRAWHRAPSAAKEAALARIRRLITTRINSPDGVAWDRPTEFFIKGAADAVRRVLVAVLDLWEGRDHWQGWEGQAGPAAGPAGHPRPHWTQRCMDAVSRAAAALDATADADAADAALQRAAEWALREVRAAAGDSEAARRYMLLASHWIDTEVRLLRCEQTASLLRSQALAVGASRGERRRRAAACYECMRAAWLRRLTTRLNDLAKARADAAFRALLDEGTPPVPHNGDSHAAAEAAAGGSGGEGEAGKAKKKGRGKGKKEAAEAKAEPKAEAKANGKPEGAAAPAPKAAAAAAKAAEGPKANAAPADGSKGKGEGPPTPPPPPAARPQAGAAAASAPQQQQQPPRAAPQRPADPPPPPKAPAATAAVPARAPAPPPPPPPQPQLRAGPAGDSHAAIIAKLEERRERERAELAEISQRAAALEAAAERRLALAAARRELAEAREERDREAVAAGQAAAEFARAEAVRGAAEAEAAAAEARAAAMAAERAEADRAAAQDEEAVAALRGRLAEAQRVAGEVEADSRSLRIVCSVLRAEGESVRGRSREDIQQLVDMLAGTAAAVRAVLDRRAAGGEAPAPGGPARVAA